MLAEMPNNYQVNQSVIPAQAGNQSSLAASLAAPNWVPAFAGTTGLLVVTHLRKTQEVFNNQTL
jgi:hypothetical protein